MTNNAQVRFPHMKMPLSKALALLILLVCGSLIIFTAVLGWQSRSEWLKNARTATENLTYSLVQHVETTLTQSDTVLIDIVERLEKDGTGERELARLKQVIDNKVAQQPQLHGLFFYDSTGRWIVHSQSNTPMGANNSDRAYFQYHRDHPDRNVHVSTPIRSRSTNEWIVPLSRRLNGPNGQFAGVVLATIKLSHFADYHSQFNVGSNGLIAMNLLSGELMTRRPEASHRLGTSFADSVLFQEHISRNVHGTVTLVSPVDHIERQYAFRRLDRFPVVVITATPVSDILSGWRLRMVWQCGFVLLLVSLIMAGGYALTRQLNLQAISKKKLNESFAKIKNLELALDEHAILIITDTDYRVTYVNEHFCKVSKYSHDDLLVENAGIANIVCQADELFTDMRSTIANGKVWKGETKNQCKDGAHYWTSLTIVPFVDEEGKPTEYVAIGTNITAQKQAEEQLLATKSILEKNNARLSLLNSQDGLTGLANRREFDRALQEEIDRAARSGTCLALLMIDVDYFKKFNDRYGHPAGDACLKQVAHTLALNAKRPTDLVARYGGEEFAVLLPNTDLQGATVVAEKMRSSLRQLKMPHAGNTCGIVTVSIGLHALLPGLANQTAMDLLKPADEALYAAKVAGRDKALSFIESLMTA